MKRVTKLFAPSLLAIALGLGVALGGGLISPAFAQPAGSADAPAGSAAVAAADAPAAAADPAPSAAPAAPGAEPAAAAPPSPAEARKLCAAAMNADPQFATEIVKTADEKAALRRDADTVAAHTDAYAHVQKNERHVIYAYAAMWIVAAGFVVFLWRRQQALRAEIEQLRRELDAASEDGARAMEGRS